MPTQMTEQVRATESAIDWESPAGGAAERARLQPHGYLYCGSGSRHWLLQPCDILRGGNGTDTRVEVVFACGCRARVAHESLIRRQP